MDSAVFSSLINDNKTNYMERQLSYFILFYFSQSGTLITYKLTSTVETVIVQEWNTGFDNVMFIDKLTKQTPPVTASWITLLTSYEANTLRDYLTSYHTWQCDIHYLHNNTVNTHSRALLRSPPDPPPDLSPSPTWCSVYRSYKTSLECKVSCYENI